MMVGKMLVDCFLQDKMDDQIKRESQSRYLTHFSLSSSVKVEEEAADNLSLRDSSSACEVGAPRSTRNPRLQSTDPVSLPLLSPSAPVRIRAKVMLG